MLIIIALDRLDTVFVLHVVSFEDDDGRLVSGGSGGRRLLWLDDVMNVLLAK